MIRKWRVNLGFWLTSQFFKVISCKQLLILGSIITRLAICITVFDIEDTDLHIIFPQTALDLGSLDDMGLLYLKDNILIFAPPDPPMPRNM